MAETSGALPDLVQLQLRIAGRETLDILGILEHEELLEGGVPTSRVEDRKPQMVPPKAGADAAVGGGVAVEAPFPGQGTKITVSVDDSGAAGDVPLVLSAMMILNDIVADRPGKITEIAAVQNSQVNDGDLPIKFEATEEAPVVDEGPA